MQTAYGSWRIKAVRRGWQDFDWLIHGDNVIDGLVIATVQRLLDGAGVDMADLIDVSSNSAGDASTSGVA